MGIAEENLNERDIDYIELTGELIVKDEKSPIDIERFVDDSFLLKEEIATQGVFSEEVSAFHECSCPASAANLTMLAY